MVHLSITTTTIITTPQCHTPAGRRPQDAPLESLFLIALKVKRRTVPYASISAKMVSQALAPSAGKTAHTTLASVTMEPTATSLMPTEEVLVKCTSADQAAKSGATSGIPSAIKASIMLAAASAHLTAQPA